MFRRLSAGVSLSIAAVLSLSGCSAVESGAGSSNGASPEPSEPTLTSEDQPAEEVDTPSGEQAATQPGEEVDTELDSSALQSSECLLGDWIVPESELQSFYDTVNVSEATFSISGDMRLTFGEDTYQFFPDFSLTLEISGLDAKGEIVGDVNGSYTADEEFLTTSYENSDDVEFVISVMGQVFDGKEMGDTFLAMFAINESPYECGSDTLTLGYQNVDGEPVVPVTFTRNS